MATKVPVVVVGNITVGGTGKTPLITWLVHAAQQSGLRPAIVSRGYGGQSENYPLQVSATSLPEEAGDEPVMLFNRLGCPVVVDPIRSRAVALLQDKADIIFSDDGLQHYAMARAAEIVVIDAQRRFGNGWLLPVGPLREPVSRLDDVDCVVTNGDDFTVEALTLVNALSGEVKPLSYVEGAVVHAVSGIGNPERFYRTLQGLGAEVVPRPFADHHAFAAGDFEFERKDDELIIMTEKDWVKCRSFAHADWWYLAVGATLKTDTEKRLRDLIRTVTSDR